MSGFMQIGNKDITPRPSACPMYSASQGYSAIVMTSRLRALGGRINNIRTSELPKEKTRSEVVCSIRFLDGLVQTFKVNKQDTGQVLLDMAYNYLGVTEKEYFGLQHGDDSLDSPRWLEASKPIRKQLKGGSDLLISVEPLMLVLLGLFLSSLLSVPAAAGSWIPGGPGDVSKLASPSLTSELAEMLPDQRPRVLTSCGQGRER